MAEAEVSVEYGFIDVSADSVALSLLGQTAGWSGATLSAYGRRQLLPLTLKVLIHIYTSPRPNLPLISNKSSQL